MFAERSVVPENEKILMTTLFRGGGAGGGRGGGEGGGRGQGVGLKPCFRPVIALIAFHGNASFIYIFILWIR